MGNDFFEKPEEPIKAERGPDGRFAPGNKGRKRGRPSKVDQIKNQTEESEIKAELLKQKIAAFQNPVKTGLKIVLNDAILSRFPADANVLPLQETELDALAGALVPVLDELGWLDAAGNPYLNLAVISIGIAIPRLKAIIEYKRKGSSNGIIDDQSGNRRKKRLRENDESESDNKTD